MQHIMFDRVTDENNMPIHNYRTTIVNGEFA